VRSCPWCAAAPYKMKYSPQGWQVDHQPGCFLRGVHKYIWEPEEDKWNTREPDYERKWSELIETTARRIAQSEDAPVVPVGQDALSINQT